MPMVGTIQASVSPITATCSATPLRRPAIHCGEKRAAVAAVPGRSAAAAMLIVVVPEKSRIFWGGSSTCLHGSELAQVEDQHRHHRGQQDHGHGGGAALV